MTEALRVYIVDDEPLARLRLRRLLGLLTDPVVVVVGESDGSERPSDSWSQAARSAVDKHASSQAARSAVDKHHPPPDVLLMDIEMPERNGFIWLKDMPEPCPLVVFVTAYSEHAAHAFDIDAIDYVLKPVSEARLGEAMQKARRAITARQVQAAAKVPYASRLSLPIGRRIQLVEVDHIDCLQAQGNYVEVKVGQRSFVLRKPLASLMLQLNPCQFVQVHRSNVVRIDAVDAIEAMPSGRYRLRLKSGLNVWSGRNFRDAVRGVFGLAMTASSSAQRYP